MPLKIVLDTNCLVSSFFSGNYSRDIVILARKRKILLVTSKTLNADLSEVFHKKVEGRQLKVNHFLNKVLSISQVVSPTETLSVIERDPDDNRVLEAAVSGECAYIVTGDKDLLTLRKYKSIKIVSPKEFLEEFSD